MPEFSIIGKSVALIDSAAKTTGAGKYTDDLSLPGMLIGKILHSMLPHARIKKIDPSKALALEGVVCVVVGEDAPNKYGILPVGHDETALAVDKVRYVGDNVACVVATTESIAEQAVELIDVEYELLPAYFDPEDAMKATSDLIHDHKANNLEKDYHHVFGDPDSAFAKCDVALEIISAVAARKAKAPVKITYTREEVFWAHRGRPRTIIDLKTGVTKDGRIQSVAAKVIQDGGAYCSYGVVTILYSGALLGALYD